MSNPATSGARIARQRYDRGVFPGLYHAPPLSGRLPNADTDQRVRRQEDPPGGWRTTIEVAGLVIEIVLSLVIRT